MDARHFDALTRVLSTADSRRRLLAAVPALGGLLGLFAAEETEGKGRRQRRKKRHKHGKRRRREKHTKQPRCAPDSDAQTCSGTCGSVQNNCRKMVDCGPCGCTGLTPSDDLQAAIDAAGSGATLTLCAGTWTPPATLEITRPLTIVGAGSEQTILDGGDQRRVLQITEDVAVTLQGFTITRGRDSFGGAGIYNTGNLALIDAVVTASHATASNQVS